jgi:hypothetical protein
MLRLIYNRQVPMKATIIIRMPQQADFASETYCSLMGMMRYFFLNRSNF